MSSKIFHEKRKVGDIEIAGAKRPIHAVVGVQFDDGLGVAVFYGSCVVDNMWAPDEFNVRDVLGVTHPCKLAEAIRAAIVFADMYIKRWSDHAFSVEETKNGPIFR